MKGKVLRMFKMNLHANNGLQRSAYHPIQRLLRSQILRGNQRILEHKEKGKKLRAPQASSPGAPANLARVKLPRITKSSKAPREGHGVNLKCSGGLRVGQSSR